MRNLAIIPARSGSKGLKDKNIKYIKGKPLLAYTISAAVESNIFEKIIVSTDSFEYAKLAQEYGAEVPFLRTEELASDTASSWDVVSDILDKYRERKVEFDSFTLLQPTSPMRSSGDIINSYDMLIEKNAKAIVSVCETEHSPLWCGKLGNNLLFNDFFDSVVSSKPRQLLEKYYRINGAIYMVKTDYFLGGTDIYRDQCYAYIMDKHRSVDIDDEFDFKFAEFVMNNYYT